MSKKPKGVSIKLKSSDATINAIRIYQKQFRTAALDEIPHGPLMAESDDGILFPIAVPGEKGKDLLWLLCGAKISACSLPEAARHACISFVSCQSSPTCFVGSFGGISETRMIDRLARKDEIVAKAAGHVSVVIA